jgi:hypothetical protein
LARTTVFGLDVHADATLPFLEGATAAATGRELSVVVADGAEVPWPPTARPISDERHPDGSVSFQIEDGGEAGYRIAGPLYGASAIAADGLRLQGSPGEGGIAAWQRLLVAQALPFVAVMRGLEVLHASAVATGFGAVAFSGPSGSGKTSLALAMRRQGATLLADDVLAVERLGEELIAHPGAPVTGVELGEAERLRGDGVDLGEVLAANPREQVARAALADAPQPLRALFLLERSPRGGQPCFEPAPDPQLLLASTFNLVLASPARLAGLLEVCAILAGQRVERVVFGPEVGPAALAVAIEARLEQAP